MRGGHCLKVWTKNQQVVSLSTTESQPYAAAKDRVRGIGNPERGEGPGALYVDGTYIWMPQRRCAWSTAEGCTRQNTSTCRTCGYKKLLSQKVCHEEGGYER